MVGGEIGGGYCGRVVVSTNILVTIAANVNLLPVSSMDLFAVVRMVVVVLLVVVHPLLPFTKEVKTKVASIEVTSTLATIVVAVAAVVAVLVVVGKSPSSIELIADGMVLIHLVKMPSPKVAAMGRSLTNR